MGATEPGAGWNTKTFVNTWPTATLASIPAPSGIAAYYCATFDITDVQAYASIEYTVATRGGYAIYFNGIESRRDRLPAGPLSYTTQSTDQDESAFTFQAAVPFAGVEMAATGNLVCIETHTETVGSVNDFAFTLTFLGNQDDLHHSWSALLE